MACHPSGVTVDIVGINASDHGRSCDVYQCCGTLVEEDTVVRFKVVQLERKPDEANPKIEATPLLFTMFQEVLTAAGLASLEDIFSNTKTSMMGGLSR